MSRGLQVTVSGRVSGIFSAECEILDQHDGPTLFLVTDDHDWSRHDTYDERRAYVDSLEVETITFGVFTYQVRQIIPTPPGFFAVFETTDNHESRKR